MKIPSIYFRLPIYHYGEGYYIPEDEWVTGKWQLGVRLFAGWPVIRYGWTLQPTYPWQIVKRTG